MGRDYITVDGVGNEAGGNSWVRFRYEPTIGGANPKQIFVTHEDVVRGLLVAIGEDPNRPGLKETPARVVRSWQELFSGYGQKPEDVLKVFTDCGRCDEMVVQINIPFTSWCEHHLLPFSGVTHVAYLPTDEKVVGLSKLARLVDIYARRLQVQERMTNQIADALWWGGDVHKLRPQGHLAPAGVGVVVQADHSCVSCRGVRKPGTTTITSALRGAFKDDPATRAEFLALTRS